MITKMKGKKLNLIIASVFTFVFLIGLISATITFSSISDLSQTGTSFNVPISSDQNETVVLTADSISDGFGNYITFTPKTITLNNESITTPMTYTVDSGFNFEFEKTYSTTLTANGSVSGEATSTINFEKTKLCQNGNPGDLRIRIDDMNVVKGFGEDDEWLPFDEIEIDIEVQNRGNEDINDVVVEWGLYNPSSGQWTIELDEEKDFNLDEDDEKIITISFSINDKMDEDLEDLEDGTYVLYVRVIGEIDNSSNMDTCESISDNVDIIVEKDFVILSDFEYPETVQCDSEFHFSAEVWNIGSRDQDDVYVKVFNRELGIDKTIEVGDINSFDNEALDFYFETPADAEEGRYSLTVSVYDEDDEVFQNDYDDESSVYDISFDIEGGCAKAEATVTASLYSGGEAGKPLVIKATIINSGQKQTTYLLNAAGYATWASSAKIEPSSFSLNSGDSKDVLITFNTNKDAVGNQLFNLEILSENQLVANQPVEVPIKKAGLSLPKLSGENWHLWAIGALNVILVILIIIIAIRISRK